MDILAAGFLQRARSHVRRDSLLFAELTEILTGPTGCTVNAIAAAESLLAPNPLLLSEFRSAFEGFLPPPLAGALFNLMVPQPEDLAHVQTAIGDNIDIEFLASSGLPDTSASPCRAPDFSGLGPTEPSVPTNFYQADSASFYDLYGGYAMPDPLQQQYQQQQPQAGKGTAGFPPAASMGYANPGDVSNAAFEYIQFIRQHLAEQPDKFETFHEIVSSLLDCRMDIFEAMQRASYLLRHSPHLLNGFNALLPQGYNITATQIANAPITIWTPWKSVSLVRMDGVAAIQSGFISSSRTDIPPSAEFLGE
ncbi:hypothetical protein BC830DRAFT_1087675 [Chytriomyces sp. MP71]|nr:hypothetical protein BC830DRAFT_1087675 [Chytriomyces sp. MP71]